MARLLQPARFCLSLYVCLCVCVCVCRGFAVTVTLESLDLETSFLGQVRISRASDQGQGHKKGHTIAFQLKADHRRTGHTDRLFYSCDLDLGQITFIYELNLDILKLYLRSKMKFPCQCFRKLEPEKDRQTDRRTDRCDSDNILPRPIRGW